MRSRIDWSDIRSELDRLDRWRLSEGKMDNAGYNLYHPCMTGKKLVKLLKAEGWSLARGSRTRK
jgi:hypothetical protein